MNNLKNFNNDWDSFFTNEFTKPYFKDIELFLKKEKKEKVIYPELGDVFNAYKETELKDLKVVILGQDPYHNPNQAHGLSFSVQLGQKIPPSLRNIYKELESSVEGFSIPSHGNLMPWSKQGVFLLNTILTVEKNSPNSHKKIGWDIFTTNTIKHINKTNKNVVFVLWGANAISKEPLIDNKNHLILKSPHPSPFSAHRGFFGSNHFNLINKYLKENNKEKIDWFL